jgi:hypothetical protein
MELHDPVDAAVLEASELRRERGRDAERKCLEEGRRGDPASGSDRHGTNIAAC